MSSKQSMKNIILVMAVEGCLDATTAVAYKNSIKTLVESGPVRLVLDLANLQFVNSAGLGVLVSTLRMAIQAGGDVKLAQLKPEMKSLFALTQLNKVFEIHESAENAVAAFGHGQALSVQRLLLLRKSGELERGSFHTRTVPA